MTLRLRGIAKAYGGRPVLAGVDLDVRAGDAVAVLGPNGSGKSTLLRIAAAIARPDQGTVEVDGVASTRRGHDDAVVRRRVAHVGQDPAPYADLTPTEHLRWWRRLQGVRPEEPELAGLLADAGLAAVAHKPAAALSRGQRQRLVLASALAGHAAVLVLDEPFTALDAQGEAWLCDRLHAARARGCALLVAVHDAQQADRLLARPLRLRDRRLEAA